QGRSIGAHGSRSNEPSARRISGGVSHSSHQPFWAGTGRADKKKPRRSAVSRMFRDVVGFRNGGGGGNRTPVRRRSAPGATCLAHRWVSSRSSTMRKAHFETSLLDLAERRQAAAISDPVIMTLHPRARAQTGSGLGLKRPERRRRRWRLSFCHRINEEDDALGMLQATSLPPSKPCRPRGPDMVGVVGEECNRGW